MRFMLSLLAFFLLLTPLVSAQDGYVENLRGERFHGRIYGLHGDLVRLSRDPGGIADFEWAQIEDLATNENIRIQLTTGEFLEGRILRYEVGRLIVDHTLLGEVKVPVASLQSAPPSSPDGEPRPQDKKKTPLDPKDWTGKVALAIAVTGGNSDTFTGTIEAFIEKNFTHDHLEFLARAVYGRANKVDNANAQLIRGKWEHFYSDRLYSYAGAEVSRDSIQEIDLRLFVNVGVGYKVWEESDKEFLALEGGVGYRHESFQSDTPSRDDLTARAALIYKDIWWDVAEFSQHLEFIAPVTDLNSFFARSESAISVPLSANWNLRNSVVLNYQNAPANNAEKLDYLITAGIEYSF